MPWYDWIWIAGSTVVFIILTYEVLSSGCGFDTRDSMVVLIITVFWWAILLAILGIALKDSFNKGSNNVVK